MTLFPGFINRVHSLPSFVVNTVLTEVLASRRGIKNKEIKSVSIRNVEKSVMTENT